MNFVEQAPRYLLNLSTRKRRPAKPATLKAYEGYIRNHIVPLIGELEVGTYSNANMRDFVNDLVSKGLGPKTTREVVVLVKQIIAGVTDAEGNRLYMPNWNAEFIDLPDLGQQKQPVMAQASLDLILTNFSPMTRVFFAFLAGTGLRIGEALATRITDDGTHTAWDPLNACVRVRTSLWQRKEQTPKTAASVREVDLDPRLNNLLLQYCASKPPREEGFLFQTWDGGPAYEPTLRRSLKAYKIQGFHCFRRYRISRLRELGTPEDIIRYWVGHAGQGITDRYSKLAEYKDLRKSWAARSGLGFELPEAK
jgi:integrase